MRQRNLKLILFSTLLLGGLFFGLLPTPYPLPPNPEAHALEVGLNAVGEEIELPGADIRVVIARIIRTALGLLGAVVVILIIYGGFVWMTAGGAEDRLGQAKRILTNAVIGLVIVLSAFAITQFVLSRLIEATTGGPPGSVSGPVGGPPAGLPSGAFVIQSVNPQNPAPGEGYPRNSVVRIRLNQAVDASTVEGNVSVQPTGSTTAVPGTLTTTGTLIQFVPTESCPAPNADRFCFAGSTTFAVQISGGLRSTSGRFVTCGGLARACTSEFTVGVLIDTEPPDVSITVPTAGQSIRSDLETIRARATDDAGVSEVEFFDGGTSLGLDAPRSPTQNFDASLFWETGTLSPQSCPVLTALARDLDTNERESSAVPVVVRPRHCFNGTQDAGETGLDCGGDASRSDYCGRCGGEACEVSPATCSSYCRSGFCSSGVCRDVPRIDNVAPLAAGPGSYVTITGEFFGSPEGTVTFLGGDGPDDDVNANLAPCTTPWTGTQIIVLVPESELLAEGPIMVTTGEGRDTTADERGFIGIFEPTTTPLAGICEITPREGQPGAGFTITGTGFGPGPAPAPGDFVQFDDRPVTILSRWESRTISGRVPVSEPGTRAVRVMVSGNPSNPVTFAVQGPETAAAPLVSAVTPSTGPPGTYVTLSGANFGSQVGQVIFTNPTSGATALGSIDFPEACSEDFWRNDQVTVKVPENYVQGTDPGTGANLAGSPLAAASHNVTVRRVGLLEATSNAVGFSVVTGIPPPGLCSLSPAAGPVGTTIHFFGEGFSPAVNEMVARFWLGSAGPSAAESPVGRVSDDLREVEAAVPSDAGTGPALVAVSGVDSNPRDFRVFDCRQQAAVCSEFGPDFQCCPNGSCASTCEAPGAGGYGWLFSTGPIPRTPRLLFECSGIDAPDPTPTPFAGREGGTNVCVNAAIAGRFSLLMDESTITPSNIQFGECTGPDENPCASTTPITLTASDIRVTPWADPPPPAPPAPPRRAGHEFILAPPLGLSPNTWYEVKLRTGIRGAPETGGEPLPEDAAGCGAGFAYCWRFKTRASRELCALGAITVNPAQATATALGEEVLYTATGRAEGDICVMIDTAPYGFSWSLGPGDASFAALEEGDPESTATATALAETVTQPTNPVVNIIAEVRTEDVTDEAVLAIDFTDPEVLEYWPNCQHACVNAGIGARFTTDMNPDTFANAVGVLRCANESCLAFDRALSVAGITLEPPSNCTPTRERPCRNTIMRVALRDSLEPQTFYRVVLAGTVESTSRVSLVGENYLDNFSWTFRTKDSDVPCSIASVNLVPAAATVDIVGARVPYTAIPRGSPDECSAQGQELVATAYNWSWNIDDPRVAQFLVGEGEGTLDTTRELPASCTSQCLLRGAAGVAGEEAVCGNGILEASLGEECDDGGISPGDGCSSICTNEGSTAEGTAWGAVCGNGGACLTDTDCPSPNDRCDLGSLTCVEYGEDCDDRNTASGDGCSVSCQSEGSVGGLAACGNGSIGVGEDCDDGNTASGDGCGSTCLAEGSNPEPFALCGNGQVERELGEECDGGAGCDPVTCLNTGTAACTPPFPSTGLNCCGNGNPDPGEDCDVGDVVGGDGCSPRCLNEGSSPFYETPSFCGDGAPGTGEECEALGGDNRIDPFQVVEAVGAGPVTGGAQTTELDATTESRVGTATFTLACGFTMDSECRDPQTSDPAPTAFGVGANSCCYARPRVEAVMPAQNEGEVCRNPVIRADFDQKIDLASFTGNVVVARADSDCQTGEVRLTQQVAPELVEGLPLGIDFVLRLRDFFSNLIPSAQAFHAPPAPPPAGTWCAGSVAGRISGIHSANDPDRPTDDTSSLFFQLQGAALDAQTWYRVRLTGDTPGGLVAGVKSESGVGMNGNFEWQFHTGNDVCDIDLVRVEDTSRTSPGLFTEANETHSFIATGVTVRGALESAIVPVDDVYDWEWDGWQSANTEIVTTEGAAPADANPNTATVRAAGNNGTTTVSAHLRLTTDTLHPVSTVGRIMSGATDVEVFLCENPGLVVRDHAGGTVPIGPNATQPHGNFTTRYCQDAGEDGPAEDLPDLTLQAVPLPPGAVQKEFLLQCANQALCGNDVIGFRMIENTAHFSAARWYTLQGFRGSPQALTVDGFEAVRDGGTVYVNAANLGADGNLHSNIYVISISAGARPETASIYEQLLANLRFNVNLPAEENTHQCINLSTGDTAEVPSCTSDLDCPVGIPCTAQNDKLRRDTRRLADFRDVEAVLASHRGASGSYPTLQAGTFVRGRTTSAWPSWLETFGQELGAFLPTDPLNRFRDCPEGYDDATCFNTLQNRYQCTTDSHVYEYTSIGPTSYRLETDLELEAPAWMPALAPIPPNPQLTFEADGAPPLACTGATVGDSTVCGDGVRGAGEVCELGETRVMPCDQVGFTGLVGTVTVRCREPASGIPGCTLFSTVGASCVTAFCGDGVRQAALGEACDDGANNGFYGFCASDCGIASPLSPYGPYCGDGGLAGVEECDRGTALNGQWSSNAADSCAWNCQFPGPYCGDGVPQIGNEECDGGRIIKQSLCSGGTRVCDADLDCPGETCSVTTTRCPDTLRCSNNSNTECTTEGATGGVCGPGGVCTRYPQFRTQSCDMEGTDRCTWETSGLDCAPIGSCGNGLREGTEGCDDGDSNNNNGCTNACRANVCGDGIPWTGVEACDFGAANGVPCTAPYGGTCNYCAGNCTYVTNNGAFCGDGAFNPPERCDQTVTPILEPPGPQGYLAGTSLCNVSCTQVCPPDYATTPVRFQEPSPSTSYTFTASGATNHLAIPACRLGAGLVVDVLFGDDVLYFPSPMDVLFVLDNSGSMVGDRMNSLRAALCGNNSCAVSKRCSTNTQVSCQKIGFGCDGNSDGVNEGICTAHPFLPGSIMARLLESRDPGDVRIGIVEWGATSRFRSWNFGNQSNLSYSTSGTTCSSDDPVPCYDQTDYGASATPSNANAGGMTHPFATGFFSDSLANREKLRAIIQSFGANHVATRAYLGLRQARAIMEGSDAASQVVIFMSDGDSSDCGPEADAPCPSSDSEAQEMNQLDDGIYLFTVSFPEVIPAMERWADPPTGSISFAYAGSDIAALFSEIIESFGVQIELSNQEDFSGPGSWVDETAIAEPAYGMLLNTTNMNQHCTESWQDVWMRILYGGEGDAATVTVQNPRWQSCPFVGF